MKRESPKTQQTRPDHHALVRIEKPIYGGAFLARVEGKAMFVPLTLPGEEARVRIVEEKRSYASAEPEEIIAAAPNRIEPGCKQFGLCGGCQYQHTDYESQLRFKEAILRETFERGGVQAPAKNRDSSRQIRGVIETASGLRLTAPGVRATASADRTRLFPSVNVPLPRRCWWTRR